MTQNGRLLNYLETHSNGITQLESFNTLGIARLSERIRELDALGYKCRHDPETTSTGARVFRYRLIGHTKVNSNKGVAVSLDLCVICYRKVKSAEVMKGLGGIK